MEENTIDSLGEHYPQDWSEFIGQEPVKRQLLVAARSSKARKKSMGHVMLSSPMAGVGKTSLAMLIVKELGVSMRMHSGPVKAAQVPYMLMDMQDGDVLFLDEIHRLFQGGKGNGEWLLHLMENGVIDGPLGMEECPKVTVVAATTDYGRLPTPVLDRFEIQPEIKPYTDAEGALIAMQLARKILASANLTLPTEVVAEAIARAGNNSPRHIRRVLCALRDLVWADEIKENGGEYELGEALSFAGVTPDGLNAQAQNYLKIMVTDFRGNPAGQKVIGDRLGEVGGGMKALEQLLLDKGLIALTKTGRMLTVDGMRRAKQVVQ